MKHYADAAGGANRRIIPGVSPAARAVGDGPAQGGVAEPAAARCQPPRLGTIGFLAWPRPITRGAIMADNPTRIELQKYLGGVDYPARKEDLVARARENGAPDDLVSALESAGEDSFDSPAAVSSAVSGG